MKRQFRPHYLPRDEHGRLLLYRELYWIDTRKHKHRTTFCYVSGTVTDIDFDLAARLIEVRLIPVAYAEMILPAWSTVEFDWGAQVRGWQTLLWWRGKFLVKHGIWIHNYYSKPRVDPTIVAKHFSWKP